MTEQPLKMSRLLSFFKILKRAEKKKKKKSKIKGEKNFLRMESEGRMLCASS